MAERLTVGVAARLSRYLQVLTQAKKMGKERISSQEISEYTNINATQIRRDLSGFGRFGKRGVGYNIDSLLGEIRKILRTQGQHNIALVGAGRLGGAIASSPIFAEHGINIAAVFDSDPAKVGRVVGGVSVTPLDTLDELVRERNIIVGVLAVPADAAQSTADALVARRREDHLQLLAGAPDDAGGRPGAHVEPRRRAALRALLPPDLSRARARPRAELVRADVRAARGRRRASAWRPRLARLDRRRSSVSPAGRMRPCASCSGTAISSAAPARTSTRRMLAREWSGAGHDVTVLSQEPHPERYDLGGATTVRPDVGGLLPVFVLDRYEGYDVRRVQDCTRAELDRWVEANAAALRSLLPADVVFANHVLLGGAGRRRHGRAVRRQGTRLRARVLDARERASSRPGAPRRWPRRARRSSARTHIRAVLAEVCGHTTDVIEVPPGVDIDEWAPEPRDAALAALLEEAGRDAPNAGQRRGAPPGRGQRRTARAFSRDSTDPSSSTSAS